MGKSIHWRTIEFLQFFSCYTISPITHTRGCFCFVFISSHTIPLIAHAREELFVVFNMSSHTVSPVMVLPIHRRRRRRHHHHHHHRPRPMVEDMEVESSPSPVVETRHRNHRERDITIRFKADDAPNGERQKSIFAENDKARPVYQRQETCRVFVQGEGEVTHFETPAYYLQMEQNQNQNNNNSSSQERNGQSASPKDSLFLDNNNSHAAVFQRSKSERPAETFMEDDGPSLRPLPYELSLIESSEDENEDEEESCLKEIFPAVYSEELRHTRVSERLADIFIHCLSVRGCLRLGPTAFRMFAR